MLAPRSRDTDEFASFETLLRGTLAALRFRRVDADGDGMVTEDELNAARPVPFPPPPF